MKKLILSSILFCFCSLSFGLQPADTLAGSPFKKKLIVGSLAGAYGGSMLGLYHLWYDTYQKSSFHLYNDNKEWLGMDKAGHVYSAYVAGKYSYEMLKWAGFDTKQAAIYGPLYGYLYQSTIEVFDGFSSEWGFSLGDVAANSLGTGLVMTQAICWGEQKISMKYSFHETPYANARPEVMGNNLAQHVFKDYNGQTYWVCANPKSFLALKRWPVWLNISLGYGATGMYGGVSNQGPGYDYSSTLRRRQWYIAPDINLEKLNVKRRWIKVGLKVLNAFKMPLPTLQITQGKGLAFKPFYF